MCLDSSLISQDDDGMKQILFRVPDELKDIGDMVFKLTGQQHQEVLSEAYRDIIYRTIKFLPGNGSLVRQVYAFANYEHEKMIKDFESKYELISSDINTNEEELSDPYWEEVTEIIKQVYEHGDIHRLREIFEKVEPRYAVIDIKAAEKSIAECIPFEIKEDVKIDALCELRFFISDKGIYTLDAYLQY